MQEMKRYCDFIRYFIWTQFLIQYSWYISEILTAAVMLLTHSITEGKGPKPS